MEWGKLRACGRLRPMEVYVPGLQPYALAETRTQAFGLGYYVAGLRPWKNFNLRTKVIERLEQTQIPFGDDNKKAGPPLRER